MKFTLVIAGQVGELGELKRSIESVISYVDCIVVRSATIHEAIKKLDMVALTVDGNKHGCVPIVADYGDEATPIPTDLRGNWQLNLAPTQFVAWDREDWNYLIDILFRFGPNHTLKVGGITTWAVPVYYLWGDSTDPSMWRTDGGFGNNLTPLFEWVGIKEEVRVSALLNLSVLDSAFSNPRRRLTRYIGEGKKEEANTVTLVENPFYPHLLDNKLQIQFLSKATSATLVTCVKNEENRLPSFLQRYSPFFYKVVLVDNGSTDKTTEIAKEYGALVVDGKDVQSFARLRNLGLKTARKIPTPWVVHIDVDEEITDLQPLARCLHDDFAEAISVTIQAPQAGLVGQAIRVFRNTEKIKYVGMVHEEVVGFKVYKEAPEINWLHNKVFDEGKERFYWGLLMQYFMQNPKEFRIWYNVGKTLRACGAMEISSLAFTVSKQLAPRSYLPRIDLAESALCVAFKMLDEIKEIVPNFVPSQEVLVARECLQKVVGGVTFPLPLSVVEKDLGSVARLANEVLLGRGNIIIPV